MNVLSKLIDDRELLVAVVGMVGASGEAIAHVQLVCCRKVKEFGFFNW